MSESQEREYAYFGRVEYPPSFENRATVFDRSFRNVLLRPASDSKKRSDICNYTMPIIVYGRPSYFLSVVLPR